jgi:hypothetical protein
MNRPFFPLRFLLGFDLAGRLFGTGLLTICHRFLQYLARPGADIRLELINPVFSNKTDADESRISLDRQSALDAPSKRI